MSAEVIRYAFVAGEISPTLFGRSDLEKYDLGLAKCHNFFVDYKGGISTRPGTIFVDYIKEDTKRIKLFPFQFNTDIVNTYLIMFGHFYVRFLQDGKYVEERTVRFIKGLTNANPGRITSTGHGYQNGDWVRMYRMTDMGKLEERIVVVANSTLTDFDMHDEHNNPIDTTNMGVLDVSEGAPRMQRIYTLTSPYSQFDLEHLRSYQIRDLLRLTHPEFKIHNLIRFDHDEWRFVVEHLIPLGDLKLHAVAGQSPLELTQEFFLWLLRLMIRR